MKNIRRIFSIGTTLLLLLALLVPAASADALYGVITTAGRNGSVNLRARAGVTQAVVGWAKNGDEVEVLLEGVTWHKVRLLKNDRIGWVYGRYLRFTDAPSASTTAGAVLSGTVAQIMTRYPSSSVNLRTGAGTNYPVIGKYARGTRLEIVDELGNWYMVRVAGTGKEGWMSRSYISLGLEGRTTGRVNLRRGPGTSYAVIRTLNNQQDVTVTWVGEDWSKVEVNGESGYISNSYYVFR